MNNRGSNLGLREERALATPRRRKKPRKTSLSHLPKAKRAEIAWVKRLIFAEFEEAITGRRAPEVRDGAILKLMLHGPYASGAWVDDAGGRYFADYDFLILVSSDRLADVGEFWLECEKKLLFASTNREDLTVPVSLTILSFERFSAQVQQGNRYFQNIMEEGVVLHDTDPTSWPLFDVVPALDLAAEAEIHLDEGMALVAEFLGSAKLSAANGWSRKAAFDLHQATERLYNIALLVLVGRTPHTHNIVDLRKLAEAANGRFRAVWPTETKEDRRCFELLRAAYNKSRYHRYYRVADSEAAWMIEHVEYLSDLVEEVCDARIDEFNRSPGEQITTLRLDEADPRRRKTGSADGMGDSEGEEIVRAYCEALAAHPECIADARLLPYSKAAIKTALLDELRRAGDLESTRRLTEHFLSLSKWQLLNDHEQAVLQLGSVSPGLNSSAPLRKECSPEYRSLLNRVSADTIILGAELQHGPLRPLG